MKPVSHFILKGSLLKVGRIKFSLINLKFRSTLFKGLRVWAEPIKSFPYIKLSGANSFAVYVLRQCLKTGDSLLGKNN